EWFLKELTSTWTTAIASDLDSLGYVSEINEQRRFYNSYVSPNVSKGTRVFVVISDALRYEVAAELSEALGHSTKGKATLEAVQSVFPSVTKFGMAALLPGKEVSVNDKMEVFVHGKPTASTVQRGMILNTANSDSVAVTYKDLLQMRQQERRDLIAGKDIIYIYHNTIDAIGDKPNTESKVSEACGTAIDELTAIVKIIVNDLSGVNIFITADHGFLYTYKPLEESQKISRQTFSGEVYELGRRYALVSPETTADYLLPIKTERTLGGVPMKGFAPQDTVRIKVQGGGENYVHGGISLQEMVVPVIVYKGMRTGYKKYVEVQNPGLSLISESRKVSNLMFSLDFLQKQAIDDKVQPCNYTLHFADDVGKPISDFQTVIADRTSGNASERVFRVRFTLKQMAFNRNKIYRLVIANETDVPEEVEFRIDIAFADDFGFDL
ncbi:MAG: BREX-1 system phosphatase PglZ type A, partial [Firmicutes bacterium]|nr:BREX-1 system phosphatase PglZ type A [Bacillota bacterium]